MYLSTYLLFLVLFISSSRFELSLDTISPQLEEPPLAFLIAQVTGDKLSLILFIRQCLYFTLNLKGIFSGYGFFFFFLKLHSHIRSSQTRGQIRAPAEAYATATATPDPAASVTYCGNAGSLTY